MEDRELLALSIVSSFFGLLMLFYLSQSPEINETGAVKIGEISGEDLGRSVKISGAIKEKSITKSRNFYGYIGDETGNIRFFVFNSNSSKNFGCIEEGKTAEMFGKIEEFGGELEIISSLDRLTC